MRFWDSSAILPLLIQDSSTGAIQNLLRTDTRMAYWWGTPVECYSALWRRQREGSLTHSTLLAAIQDLQRLLAAAVEIQPRPVLRSSAQHLVASHALRAADALQLAAALSWAEASGEPAALVSLDQRLREAALREGLQTLPE